MDWTDPEVMQALAVAAVVILAPVVVWVGRKLSPDFHYGPKWQKRTVAILVTAGSAFAVVPGTWQQKAAAAGIAVLLSQFGYQGVKRGRANGGE